MDETPEYRWVCREADSVLDSLLLLSRGSETIPTGNRVSAILEEESIRRPLNHVSLFLDLASCDFLSIKQFGSTAGKSLNSERMNWNERRSQWIA